MCLLGFFDVLLGSTCSLCVCWVFSKCLPGYFHVLLGSLHDLHVPAGFFSCAVELLRCSVNVLFVSAGFSLCFQCVRGVIAMFSLFLHGSLDVLSGSLNVLFVPSGLFPCSARFSLCFPYVFFFLSSHLIFFSLFCWVHYMCVLHVPAELSSCFVGFSPCSPSICWVPLTYCWDLSMFSMCRLNYLNVLPPLWEDARDPADVMKCSGVSRPLSREEWGIENGQMFGWIIITTVLCV